LLDALGAFTQLKGTAGVFTIGGGVGSRSVAFGCQLVRAHVLFAQVVDVLELFEFGHGVEG
jgi:hypothetical protein